jgi:hypothetical protein
MLFLLVLLLLLLVAVVALIENYGPSIGKAHAWLIGRQVF